MGRAAAPIERLWTVDEVATFLGITKRAVYKWAAAGKLPCVRLSSCATRFRPEDIREFCDRRTTGRPRPVLAPTPSGRVRSPASDARASEGPAGRSDHA